MVRCGEKLRGEVKCTRAETMANRGDTAGVYYMFESLERESEACRAVLGPC